MSYMDRKNILSEGFFDLLKKILNRPKLSSKDKKLMKNPAFKKLYNKYIKMSKDTDDSLKKQLDKLGVKSRFR